MVRRVPSSVVEQPSIEPASVTVSYTLSTTCEAEVKGAPFAPTHRLSPSP